MFCQNILLLRPRECFCQFLACGFHSGLAVCCMDSAVNEGRVFLLTAQSQIDTQKLILITNCAALTSGLLLISFYV